MACLRKTYVKRSPARALLLYSTAQLDWERQFALVTRYVTDDLRIVQRWASLKCVEKSMSGNDVSGLLMDIIIEDLHVQRHNVVAAMRDGASVNGLAMKNLQDVFPNMFDITCFSHTLDRVGGYFKKIPNALAFCKQLGGPIFPLIQGQDRVPRAD
eukprot:scpid89831/ scgid29988/ 